MKKYINFITFAIALSFFLAVMFNLKPSQAEPPETRIIAWTNIRSTDANDPNASTPTAWADRPDHGYSLYVKQTPDKIGQINTAIIRFRFSDPNGTANYYVMTRQYGDDAEFACSGALTAGTQAATAGGYYADTITVTADRSLTGASSTDSAGHNEMARLMIGTLRAEILEVYFDDIQAGTVYADIR